MNTSFENKIQNYISDNKEKITLGLIVILSLVWRYAGRNFLSEDMEGWLLPWYQEIKESGGVLSLSRQVGNYGLLYQTLIALMTYVDIEPIYLYKMLSVVFDFFLAYIVYAISKEQSSRSADKILSPAILGGVILIIPTIVINSAFWGQCDSMYSFFCLLTLYCLYKERYVWAFAALGLAFACKLQTVFILPFVFFYYFKSKGFSLLYGFVSIAVMWLTGIGAFVQGRSLLAPMEIYMGQTNEYKMMYLNFPSFWVISGGDYSMQITAIIFTCVICGMGGYIYLSRKSYDSKDMYYEMATWFVWTMLIFLPSMHERYAYLLDVLLMLLSYKDRSNFVFAITAVCISLFSYSIFLFKHCVEEDMLWVSVTYLIAYLCYSYKVFARKMSARLTNA